MQIKQEEKRLEELFDKTNYFIEDGLKNLDKIKEKDLILWEDIIICLERIKKLKKLKYFIKT